MPANAIVVVAVFAIVNLPNTQIVVDSSILLFFLLFFVVATVIATLLQMLLWLLLLLSLSIYLIIHK